MRSLSKHILLWVLILVTLLDYVFLTFYERIRGFVIFPGS